MQKILRVLIIIAMLITSYLLILAWRDDYANAPAPSSTPAVATLGNDIPGNMASANGDIPAATTVGVAVADQSDAVISQDTGLVNVSTDLYDIKIDPTGGDVVYAALKQYDATLDSEQPFVLLQNDSNRVYVAQSGLMGQDGIDTSDGRATYQTTSNNYVLTSGQQTLSVPLVYKTENGVTITKTYTFTQGKYPIEVSYNINNASSKPWQGQLFAQLKRDDSKDPGLADKGALSMATYLGGAWGTPDDSYNKLKFGDFNDGELTASSQEGWVGMVQHYFVSAWTPNNFAGQFFSRENNGDYFIGFNSQPLSVAAGKHWELFS